MTNIIIFGNLAREGSSVCYPLRNENKGESLFLKRIRLQAQGDEY
jgi:hypothetical protein